jgi:hypothetical protein
LHHETRNKVNNNLKINAMSGQKKLKRACRNNRVIAVPSKKCTNYMLDEYGHVMYANNKPITKETQLYNIFKLR